MIRICVRPGLIGGTNSSRVLCMFYIRINLAPTAYELAW
ncbi:hypothetical protein MUK42_17117 [Musa troglodytarum]|uniref:Uncharacterized protein n=1 Tax=Musa troglodytarum TaxID=320322 RepID=A0A9E7K8F2_9LILI|nr:hypothetical protein MUK42_17117 [Musa troglodytarum]